MSGRFLLPPSLVGKSTNATSGTSQTETQSNLNPNNNNENKNSCSVDADFDSFWEEEARNPHRNRIRIGRQYQATVPPLLKPGESDKRKLDDLETLRFCPKKSSHLSKYELDHYFNVANSMNLFASLVETRCLLGKDVTIADLNHIRRKEGLSLASVIQPPHHHHQYLISTTSSNGVHQQQQSIKTSPPTSPSTQQSQQQSSANGQTGQDQKKDDKSDSSNRKDSSNNQTVEESKTTKRDDSPFKINPLIKALSHFIALHHPVDHREAGCKKKNFPPDSVHSDYSSFTSNDENQRQSSSPGNGADSIDVKPRFEVKMSRSRSARSTTVAAAAAASSDYHLNKTTRQQQLLQPDQSLQASQQSTNVCNDWTREEIELFTKALEICGKNFGMIKKEFFPTKSIRSIVEHYYIGTKDSPTSSSTSLDNDKQSNSTLTSSVSSTSPGKTRKGIASADASTDTCGSGEKAPTNNNNRSGGSGSSSGSSGGTSSSSSSTARLSNSGNASNVVDSSKQTDTKSAPNDGVASPSDSIMPICGGVGNVAANVKINGRSNRTTPTKQKRGQAQNQADKSDSKNYIDKGQDLKNNKAKKIKDKNKEKFDNDKEKEDPRLSVYSFDNCIDDKIESSNSNVTNQLSGLSRSTSTTSGTGAGAEVKPLKAKPIFPNSSCDSDSTMPTMGSLKFYMDGQLVLKLNATQAAGSSRDSSGDKSNATDKCQWVQSQDVKVNGTIRQQRKSTKRKNLSVQGHSSTLTPDVLNENHSNSTMSNSVMSSNRDDAVTSSDDDSDSDDASRSTLMPTVCQDDFSLTATPPNKCLPSAKKARASRATPNDTLRSHNRSTVSSDFSPGGNLQQKQAMQNPLSISATSNSSANCSNGIVQTHNNNNIQDGNLLAAGAWAAALNGAATLFLQQQQVNPLSGSMNPAMLPPNFDMIRSPADLMMLNARYNAAAVAAAAAAATQSQSSLSPNLADPFSDPFVAAATAVANSSGQFNPLQSLQRNLAMNNLSFSRFPVGSSPGCATGVGSLAANSSSLASSMASSTTGSINGRCSATSSSSSPLPPRRTPIDTMLNPNPMNGSSVVQRPPRAHSASSSASSSSATNGLIAQQHLQQNINNNYSSPVTPSPSPAAGGNLSDNLDNGNGFCNNTTPTTNSLPVDLSVDNSCTTLTMGKVIKDKTKINNDRSMDLSVKTPTRTPRKINTIRSNSKAAHKAAAAIFPNGTS